MNLRALRGLLFACALVALQPRPAMAAELTWITRLDSASALDGRNPQKLEFSVQPTLDLPLGEQWQLRGIARLRLDAAAELALPHEQRQARSPGTRAWLFADDHAELELRELFVDGAVGDVQLRLGKQQVVWGQADGLRVLDVVNPMSLREFVLPSPEDRRIPLWTVNAELPLAGGSLQLLWIPDATGDEVPRGEHPFAVTSPLFVPRAPTTGAGTPVPVSVKPVRRPDGLRGASDVGARWSGQAGSWDLTLNALYRNTDQPVPYRRIAAGGVVIEPRHARTALLGGSYSTALGPVTLRGEVGYSTRRFLPTADRTDDDGVFEARELAHVVGLDYTGVDDTLVSVQLFQSRISARPDGATRRRVENQATLLVQHEALNQSVRLRALWLHGLDRGDRALQAQLSWRVRSDAVVSIGIEHFGGDRDGLFGQFRDASRATLGLELGF